MSATNPTYKEFVATHGGTSTPALATAWKKRFGPTAQPAPAAAPAPVLPTPVGVAPDAPGTGLTATDFAGATGLDPTAQTSIADAAQRYATGLASVNANAASQMQGYAAQLPQLAHQYDMANLDTTRQMAGRGLLRSGLTEVGKGENRAAYDTGLNNVARGWQQATNDWQSQLGGLANGLSSDTHGAQNDAAQRYLTDRYSTYGDTYGVNSGTGSENPAPTQAMNPVTAPTLPAPKPATPAAPSVSYQDFVKSHGGTSTNDLAQAWDKRFNNSQRFG